VEGGGQFDNAKTGAEMSTGNGHRIDGFLTKLVGNLTNPLDLQLPEIFRSLDGIEQRCLTKIGHGTIPILHVRDCVWLRGRRVSARPPDNRSLQNREACFEAL
jgi:hypothetical protein